MPATLQSPANNALTRSSEGDLAPVEGLAPVMTVEQALARYRQLQDVARQLLRENHDFGVIPGTESKDGKPPRKALLQPGAEKLSTFFGLRPIFEDAGSTRDWEAGLFDIRITCTLLRNARREYLDSGGLVGRPVIVGDVVVTATRSANSREKKYRRGARACPTCGAATIIRSKFPKENPKWWCDKRNGGCGSEFDGNDQRILEQAPTIDPLSAADLVNTLEGMAQKRALVAAVRLATNASDLFEDDDNDPTGEDDAERRPAPRKGTKEAPTIDEGQWEVLKSWLDHHGLSVRLFLAHFGITKPRELPLSKEPEAFKLARQGNPAWREARPAAPARATGQEGASDDDAGQTEPPRKPATERPGRATAGQVEEIEAELTRAGIVGTARADLMGRYHVKDPADLYPAQADALLIELRDLPTVEKRPQA